MKNFYRPGIVAGLLMVLISRAMASQAVAGPFLVPTRRPSPERWCFDYAGVLGADQQEKINDQGQGIRKGLDVDLVVVTVPDLDGREISDYTVDLFSRWQIGRSTQGKKGVLILIAQKEQTVRIEVGVDLEGIYTDAYVGETERTILTEFLEQAEWGVGFLATIESFVFRLYNQEAVEEARNIAAPGDPLPYYSQGAGASGVFDFGAALNRLLPDDYAELRAYFSAQPTPQDAFERYMELCAKGVKHNNDLTLFTDLSNQFWSQWPHTSGQQKSEAREVSGRPYLIKQKDNHAVVFFPETEPARLKKAPMYYLARSAAGWQVDINAMTRGMRCVGPGWWMVTDIFHAYSAIILEEYNLVNGFLTPWGDTAAYTPFANLDSYFYDEKEPGHHITARADYEAVTHLKTGDSVLAVNGQAIKDSSQFWRFFDDARAGDEYTFTILRDGKQKTVQVQLPGQPDGFRFYRPCLKTPRQWLGVYMVQSLDSEWDVTRELRNQGKFRYSSLCAILDVAPGSPADRAGLRPNDLIVHYGEPDDNGEVMPRDVIESLYRRRPGEAMDLLIVRDLKQIIKIKVTPEQTWQEGYF